MWADPVTSLSPHFILMEKKKKKMVGHQKNKKSRHHIVPKSRGGKANLENIVELDVKIHRVYHTLFQNRTPEEIIAYLVTDYWNSNWNYVEKARNNYINQVLNRHYK